MAPSNLFRLVVGGSLAAWGIGVLFVGGAFDSLESGLYQALGAASETVPPYPSYIVQAALPPHLRLLKQGIEKLRQSLEEFDDTLLAVEEALHHQADAATAANTQAEEEGSQDVGKGPTEILSMAEVCRELGMSKSWVYNRLRSGQIPSIKLGGAIKIKRADLNEYIEKQPYHSFDKD